MRPVALGRKELATCRQRQCRTESRRDPVDCRILRRRIGVPLKDYLLAVLPGKEYRKHAAIAHLTPSRWATARI